MSEQDVHDWAQVATVVSDEGQRYVMTLARAASYAAQKTTEKWVDRINPDELLGIVCPKPHSPRPITHDAPVGALALWREELRRHVRSRHTMDTLWSAACFEASGVEALHRGLPLAASDWFATAERTIADAIATKVTRKGS